MAGHSSFKRACREMLESSVALHLLDLLVAARLAGEKPCTCTVNCAVRGQEFIVCLCPDHAKALYS